VWNFAQVQFHIIFFLPLPTQPSAPGRDEKGDWYAYSFGGYHADDDERTVLQADSQGGAYFKSSPIDVHICDVGKQEGAELLEARVFLVVALGHWVRGRKWSCRGREEEGWRGRST